MDATGSPVHGRQLILNAEGAAWLEKLFVELNDAHRLGQDPRVLPDPEIVTDDTLMRDHGIRTVLPAREMYGWSETHHNLEDTLEMVDLRNVRTVTQLVVFGGRSLAGE